jgi:nitronate monooxygenase
MANIDHPQVRNGRYIEMPLITSGNDLIGVAQFLKPGASSYAAADVVAKLMDSISSCTGLSEASPRLAERTSVT